MNETTSSVLEGTQADRQEIPALEITEITFENNDPCKPQYTSLYKEPHNAPLEPAFQIDSSISQLSVTVRLAESSDVVLVDDPKHPGKPLCRVLNELDYLPTIDYVGMDQKSCTLTWHRLEGAPVTRVFRIYCKPKTGEYIKEQKVYGGLFLAFTTHDVGKMENPIPPEDPGNSDRSRIHLVGADHGHRPIYDLHELSIPVDLKVELEPAYRFHYKSAPLSFQMIVAIPNAVWKPDLKFLQPLLQPEELKYAGEPKVLSFVWEDNGNPLTVAKITTFHAVPQIAPGTQEKDLPEGWTMEEYAEALQEIGVDPTIIQPPVCDPVYGVCAE